MRSVPLLATQGRGRPKKYGRPARAVTVTLPEDILATLSAADTDLGRAIVRLVERRGKALAIARKPAAEIAPYGNRSIIIVPEARALRRLPGVQLVPIGNGRCLIALEPPVPDFATGARYPRSSGTEGGIRARTENARCGRGHSPDCPRLSRRHTRRTNHHRARDPPPSKRVTRRSSTVAAAAPGRF